MDHSSQTSPLSIDIDRLVTIMARLRDPEHGCEWDTVQTFASIAPYTIEEAYEVADAIERADMADLKDELGDLLLQVVFHARMAEEAGDFALADVIASICDKMERRHPHIFGDAAEGGHYLWEQIKAEERDAKGADSALDGVAIGLPALLRAEKLQKRAARTGFDWPDPTGARAKIDEELAEVEDATSDAEREEEIGDLLFATVNWARKLGIDPEAALRAANAKFERRFREMEGRAPEPFATLDLERQETLWQVVKGLETGAKDNDGAIKSTGLTLAQTLLGVLRGVAAAAHLRSAILMSCSVSFSFPVRGPTVGDLPIVLLPPTEIGSSDGIDLDMARVTDDLAAAVLHWLEANNPATHGSFLALHVRAWSKEVEVVKETVRAAYQDSWR